ncbi:MAG: TetR/AcrR family transcriptional regulator [Bryobacteraceae bacterium]|jgi:AcrR family transcriptional regulator
MPYPAGHREQVRRRIVESARRLFNRSGFAGVSVDSIMAHAGLTRGGFYSYFASKSDLYAEVLGCFFTDPNWKSRWEGVDVDLASAGAGPQIVRAYLSRQHFDDVENSCPMVALPSDVARGDERVRTAFETVFKAMVALLDRDVRNGGKPRENTAMAIAALCVGGMVVARSMNDRGLADRLREAATRVALELGGWSRARPSQSRAGTPARARVARKASRSKRPAPAAVPGPLRTPGPRQ